MKYAKYGNYDKSPKIKADGEAYCGFNKIIEKLNGLSARVVVLDCYPIVDLKSLIKGLEAEFDYVFNTDEVFFSGDELTEKLSFWLTDDRVFGKMILTKLSDYIIDEKLTAMQEEIKRASGRILVAGVGAMLICRGDVNIHCSIARWESQLRFRQGAPNWNCNNYDMDCLTKFKRGYFAEWRLADKHKTEYAPYFDFYIDTNDRKSPRMFSRKDYENALEKAASAPFRVVPYFDPGVWGGQWMKQVCGLDKAQANFAWCFDCVPEENSVLYDFNGVIAEMPAIDIVLFKGKKLLGDRVQARFGNEFPIRFDFLDTMEGGNLSLQVHPATEYIQEHFNMKYTQDESYYIVDCGEKNPAVYLGVKTGADKQSFIADLHSAQISGQMDVDKYVNKWKVKKHDHLLIPAGTIHCSGANTVVLEISSTPYIFTFKLWDWGRLGLDGKPRPINLTHGEKVLDFSRNTEFAEKQLVNIIERAEETLNYTEEKTGLHKREFIETRRHWFIGEVLHKGNDSVNVLNLVEGEEAEVVSINGKFQPFIVHYAETFIVPASVGDYIIRPTKKSQGTRLATIKAYIRG